MFIVFFFGVRERGRKKKIYLSFLGISVVGTGDEQTFKHFFFQIFQKKKKKSERGL